MQSFVPQDKYCIFKDDVTSIRTAQSAIKFNFITFHFHDQ
jgi:hypothetical protein